VKLNSDMLRTSIGSCRRRERRKILGSLGFEFVCGCLSFILLIFLFQTLGNFVARYHEAVGGFFGASQGRAANTSFEGGNKSGATA
jgi:hypothetical protein